MVIFDRFFYVYQVVLEIFHPTWQFCFGRRQLLPELRLLQLQRRAALLGLAQLQRKDALVSLQILEAMGKTRGNMAFLGKNNWFCKNSGL